MFFYTLKLLNIPGVFSIVLSTPVSYRILNSLYLQVEFYWRPVLSSPNCKKKNAKMMSYDKWSNLTNQWKTGTETFILFCVAHFYHTCSAVALNVLSSFPKSCQAPLLTFPSYRNSEKCDVTAAILMYQNNAMAAMLMSQIQTLFSFVTTFFSSNKFAWRLLTGHVDEYAV